MIIRIFGWKLYHFGSKIHLFDWKFNNRLDIFFLLTQKSFLDYFYSTWKLPLCQLIQEKQKKFIVLHILWTRFLENHCFRLKQVKMYAFLSVNHYTRYLSSNSINIKICWFLPMSLKALNIKIFAGKIIHNFSMSSIFWNTIRKTWRSFYLIWKRMKIWLNKAQWSIRAN